MRDGFADRARGDFGEHHAMQRAVLQQTAFAQDFRDVPGNRLAFAIRVGRQKQGFSGFGGLGDRLDVLLVLVDRLVTHREIITGVDRTFLRHQVAHMAI